MCECLAYEDGTTWLCEACGPRWLEHEHKLSERPAPAPIAAAIEEAREALARAGALESYPRPITMDALRAVVVPCMVEAYREVARRYFAEKGNDRG